MDLGEIEQLMRVFKRMLEKHPEICPHDYCLESYKDNEYYNYRCPLCGHTETRKDRLW